MTNNNLFPIKNSKKMNPKSQNKTSIAFTWGIF